MVWLYCSPIQRTRRDTFFLSLSTTCPRGCCRGVGLKLSSFFIWADASCRRVVAKIYLPPPPREYGYVYVRRAGIQKWIPFLDISILNPAIYAVVFCPLHMFIKSLILRHAWMAECTTNIFDQANIFSSMCVPFQFI